MKGIFSKLKQYLATAAISAQLLAFGAGAAWAVPVANLKVKLLAINDFHGQLSPKTVSGRPAGGAAVLASYLKNARTGMEDRSIIASAGDFVGASPANSALLQDEPSIQFLNTLANAYCSDKMNSRCNIVATVGNHEFDEGVAELQRMMNGGNHANGPFLENPYGGARYPFVAANVVDTATGNTLLPPYVIKTVRNTPIAFIGAVLKDTPNIVAPAGVAGLTFLDEATAINSYIPELQAKGVKAIVAVIHQGGADVDSIVSKLDGEIDVVISGHSHGNTNKLVKNAAGKDVLVTQAYSASTAYADINLEIDPYSKDIVKKTASIVTTYGDAGPGLTPDMTVAGIVDTANTTVQPLVSVVVGETSAGITRTQNPAGESALGNLIADAQRAFEGTDFAFMNPGGIRADLDKGPVAWGELFTTQPFGNLMVRMTLTGQQIYDVLAQQWANPSYPRMLQVSGLTYTWTDNGAGKAGTITEVLKDGISIDKGLTYTVTVNNFLAGGGDSFTVFKSGLNPVVDAADIDVLVSYIKGLAQPFNATIEGRVTKIVPTASAAAAKFAVFSDPHLYDVSILGGVTNGVVTSPELAADLTRDRKMLVESGEILTSVINDLKTKPLDFVLVTGDLTKDGELVDHQLMAARLSELKGTAKKVFVIPGNHDIYNPHALNYTTSPPTPAAFVSPAEFKQIYADFGYKDAIYKDPNSLSYIAEPVPGVWLFALDSCRYADNLSQGSPETTGAFSAATQTWILDRLNAAKSRGKSVIGMMHHGLLEHFTGQSVQFPEYVLQDWQTVSKSLADSGLNIIFTGHFHANDVTQKDFATSVLEDIESGSLVTYPSPYRTVDFDLVNSKLAIQTTDVASIASHPSDFVDYAKNYLQSGMTGITRNQLAQPPYNLTDPTLSYVTGLVVPAFMAHYAGDETPDATTVANYTSMMGSPDPVTKGLGQSLYSLWTDLLPGDNNLELTIGGM
ncbi:MAG: hypothetical protein FD174_1617 [Geobacteraceae bacterium]|nr:MAG: hypothetical protein FD174_1617 [Geobacteraceae bacterium]